MSLQKSFFWDFLFVLNVYQATSFLLCQNWLPWDKRVPSVWGISHQAQACNGEHGMLEASKQPFSLVRSGSAAGIPSLLAAPTVKIWWERALSGVWDGLGGVWCLGVSVLRCLAVETFKCLGRPRLQNCTRCFRERGEWCVLLVDKLISPGRGADSRSSMPTR